MLQKKIPGYDLVAISEDKVQGHIVGQRVFRISGVDDKTIGLTFLYSEPLSNDILSGTCKINSATKLN